MCTKVRHKSKLGAQIAKSNVKNKQLDTYYCKECKAWHLGTSRNPLRKMDRINALLDRVMEGGDSNT